MKWLPAYLTLALIWGCSFYFIKLGLESFTPAGVASGRLFFGAITLLVALAITKSTFPPRRYLVPAFIYAAIVSAIPWLLFAWAETQVTSALAGVINGVTPLATLVAILVAFPEEKPTRQRMLGLGIGFIGVLIVIGIGTAAIGGSALGMLACFGAISCYGFSYPFARRYLLGGEHAGRISSLSLASSTMVFGLIVTIPFTLVFGITQAPLSNPHIQLSSVLGILALGCLGSGIAYVLNFRILALTDATTTSTVTYITPLVAVLAGALFLDEHITWNQPVGGVLVVLGAAIAQGVLTLGKRGLDGTRS